MSGSSQKAAEEVVDTKGLFRVASMTWSLVANGLKESKKSTVCEGTCSSLWAPPLGSSMPWVVDFGDSSKDAKEGLKLSNDVSSIWPEGWNSALFTGVGMKLALKAWPKALGAWRSDTCKRECSQNFSIQTWITSQTLQTWQSRCKCLRYSHWQPQEDKMLGIPHLQTNPPRQHSGSECETPPWRLALQLNTIQLQS